MSGPVTDLTDRGKLKGEIPMAYYRVRRARRARRARHGNAYRISGGAAPVSEMLIA